MTGLPAPSGIYELFLEHSPLIVIDAKALIYILYIYDHFIRDQMFRMLLLTQAV